MQVHHPKIKETLLKIQNLPAIPAQYHCDHGIRISMQPSKEQYEQILHIAQELKPWRKGPFYLNDLFIDAEWKSFIKWNQIAPHIHLKDKEVLDVGCNNGYYLFEMLQLHPKTLIGFDPGEIFFAQFCLINHFLKAPIVYEMLGVDDVKDYGKKFDVIFCLGVLYHRSDPIRALKSLSQGLKSGGVLILDTLLIDDPREIALSPKHSYAKMKNVYFIPSIPALLSWCNRAKLELVEILSIKETTLQEQRKTPWIDTLSLDSFLNTKGDQTIEGYPAPKRGYFKFKRS